MPFQIVIFFNEMRIEISQWQAFDSEYMLSRHRISYLETTLKSAFCVGDCALFEFDDVPSGLLRLPTSQ